jgi:predicted aspartyl protease
MGTTRRQTLKALIAFGAAGALVSPATAALAEVAAGAGRIPDPPPARPLPEPEPEAAAEEPDGQVAGGRDRNDHLTAPVTLNGRGPYPFIVDTGASISCVAHDLALELNLPIQSERQVHTIVGSTPQPVAMVDELQIGVRRARKMSALALKLVQPGVQGVLAVDWLKGQRLTLNFAANRLEFEQSRDERSAPGVVVVPARRRHGQLTIVDADLGDHRISAMIDSGSEISLCNSHLLDLLDRKRSVVERKRIEMVTIIGEVFSGELVMLPFLRLGGMHLGNVPVVHSDTHVFQVWGLSDKPAVLLGMDLLRQFRAVSLDFGRSQVRFDLPPGASTAA